MSVTKVSVDDFYMAYTNAVKKLYTSSVAKQNHLEPANKTSFQRTIARKAGLTTSSVCDSYAKKDLVAVVNDTNAKYEEYDIGQDYSQSVRSKGKLRYEVFSDVLYVTLESLGLKDVAEQLKYTKQIQRDKKVEEDKTDAQVLEETLGRVGAIKETKENKEETLVTDTIKTLNDSVDKIDKFAVTISGIPNESDIVKLEKFSTALKTVIEDSRRFTTSREDLSDAIASAEATLKRIAQIQARATGPIDDTALQKLQDHFNGDSKEETTVAIKDAKTIENVEAMIPAVLEAIPNLLKRGQKSAEELTKANERINALLNEIEELKKQVSEAENTAKLPEDDDALFEHAKEAIGKIGDKAKLKDLGMIIMMKAL